MSKLHEFSTTEEQNRYFEMLFSQLDMLAKACSIEGHTLTRNGGRECDDLDNVLKYGINCIYRSILALSYKYKFEKESNNVPSSLSVIKLSSGMPSSTCYREMSMDKKDPMEHSLIIADVERHKKTLLYKALEDKFICKNTQSKIAHCFYKDILSAGSDILDIEPSFHIKESRSNNKVNGIVIIVGGYSTSLNIPLFLKIQLKVFGDGDLTSFHSDDIERVINKFSFSDNILRLATSMNSELQHKHPSLNLYVESIDRISIGPFLLNGITSQPEPFQKAFDKAGKNSGCTILTVESLVASKVKRERVGLFSKKWSVTYGKGKNSSSEINLGPASVSEKLVLPYSVFQHISSDTSYQIKKCEKVVVDDNGAYVF